MARIRFPRPGEHVAFWDGSTNLTGVCNGEPFHGNEADARVVTHIPVYVHDGDRCIMVAVKNITSWPDEDLATG